MQEIQNTLQASSEYTSWNLKYQVYFAFSTTT